MSKIMKQLEAEARAAREAKAPPVVSQEMAGLPELDYPGSHASNAVSADPWNWISNAVAVDPSYDSERIYLIGGYLDGTTLHRDRNDSSTEMTIRNRCGGFDVYKRTAAVLPDGERVWECL